MQESAPAFGNRHLESQNLYESVSLAIGDLVFRFHPVLRVPTIPL